MRQILFFCAMIGIAAVFAPQFLQQMGQRGSASQQSSPNIRLDRAETQKREKLRRSAGNTVEVRAGRNGHFLVDADVNLRPVRFVVDTGASLVAMRQSDAESAGIYLTQADFRVPVSTANGTAYAAPVRLDTLAIEGIDMDGVNALVLPDNLLGTNLLGNSFLSRLQKFQVSGNMLVMEN